MNKAEIVFEKIAANSRTKYLLYLGKKLPQVSRAYINKDLEDYLLSSKNLVGKMAAKSKKAEMDIVKNLDSNPSGIYKFLEDSETASLYRDIHNKAVSTGKTLKKNLDFYRIRN